VKQSKSGQPAAQHGTDDLAAHLNVRWRFAKARGPARCSGTDAARA